MSVIGKNFGKPTLDLNFAGNKSLIDTTTGTNYVTFSRAQSGNEATYVGSDGLIKYASADEPRFDHDPVTGECLGLLVEESRTNLLAYSEQFDNATWGKTSVSVTADAASAPDGSLTADKATASLGGGDSFFLRTVGSTGVTYTVSCFVKKDTGNWFAFSNSANFAFFNIQNGTLGTIQDGTATITPFPNGWYRCTWTPASTAANNTWRFRIVTNNDASAANGESLFLWGAQLEQGSFPTSYIPTSGSTVTRETDLVSILGSNYTSIFGTTLGSGSIFADVKVLGEKNNTQSSSFAGFGTSANDIFTFFLTYDNRTNVGFSLPVDGNVSKYHDLTGQRVKGAVSWTDLEVSISDQTNASNALDGDLYGGSQYNNIGSSLNSQYDRFGIGRSIRSSTASNSINGHISRLTYWPKRLPDGALQFITS